MLKFIYLALALGLAASSEMDWFDNLVKEQRAYVNKKYPQPAGVAPLDLLEACGGIGGEDKLAPGECIPGIMSNTSNFGVPYIRLVFTPLPKHTAPVVLVMINVFNNTVEHQYIEDQHWIGDNQRLTSWNSSNSLADAYDVYKHGVGNATKGGEIASFVWRAMVLLCATEPVWIFETPDYA